MHEKYNPAPVDEHAMDLKEALRSDKKSQIRLRRVFNKLYGFGPPEEFGAARVKPRCRPIICDAEMNGQIVAFMLLAFGTRPRPSCLFLRAS
jgi:hypothetical protein